MPAFISPVFAVEGYSSVTTFGDIDDDGDIDAFVSSSRGHINYFENISTNSTVPDLKLISTDNAFGLFDVGFGVHPKLVDLDCDDDLDMFVAGRESGSNRRAFYFENIGNASAPAFSLTTSTAPFGLSGTIETITFVDIDADGDIDAFAGNAYSAFTQFYENTSSDNSIPAFTLSADGTPFGIEVIPNYSKPSHAFADLDGDKDLDLLIGSRGTLVYHENTSTDLSVPAFNLVSSANAFGIMNVGSSPQPSFVDLDNDGLLELAVGEFSGNVNYFESDVSAVGNVDCVLKDLTLLNAPIPSNTYSSQKSIIARSKVEAANTVTFIAADSIVLKPDFYAKSGSTFTAKIDNCTLLPANNNNNVIEERTEEIAVNIHPSTDYLSVSPNPFNSNTTIEFELNTASNVQLSVFDLQGRVVQQIYSGTWLEAGQHRIQIEATNWKAGMYLIRMQTTEEVVVKQLILQR